MADATRRAPDHKMLYSHTTNYVFEQCNSKIVHDHKENLCDSPPCTKSSVLCKCMNKQAHTHVASTHTHELHRWREHKVSQSPAGKVRVELIAVCFCGNGYTLSPRSDVVFKMHNTVDAQELSERLCIFCTPTGSDTNKPRERKGKHAM